MENLGFENASVTYCQEYLPVDRSDQIFILVKELFGEEERRPIVDGENNIIYTLNRKTIVFVDKSIDRDIIPKIWGNKVTVMEFPPELEEIRKDLETILDFKFNICLANYYDSGKNGIAWHSDNEEKGSTSCIASLSFGEERNFTFRIKDTKNIYREVVLHHGSLLVMGTGCQENYQHSLPQDKSYKNPRLNLTFRLFDSDRYKHH